MARFFKSLIIVVVVIAALGLGGFLAASLYGFTFKEILQGAFNYVSEEVELPAEDLEPVDEEDELEVMDTSERESEIMEELPATEDKDGVAVPKDSSEDEPVTTVTREQFEEAVVNSLDPLVLSCDASPNPAKVGDTVMWQAQVVEGPNVPSGYFKWSGDAEDEGRGLTFTEHDEPGTYNVVLDVEIYPEHLKTLGECSVEVVVE